MAVTIRDLAKWPAAMADVTTDVIIRATGVEAQRAWLQKSKTLERSGKEWRDLYIAQVEACISAVGFMGCLMALRKADPVAAQQYAEAYWGMCEDGGLIGEMLWEWLEQAGVRPELVEEALAVDAVDPHAGTTTDCPRATDSSSSDPS